MTEDPYAKICRAMDKGLLITVNNDDSAVGSPSDELYVRSGGNSVLLEDRQGNDYLLFQNRDGDTTLVEITDQGHGNETYVETIEIVGIRHEHK